MRQLPLPFPHTPEFSPDDFIESPSNEAARRWLTRPEDWPGGRLALYGEAAVGKSHLLHVWAQRSHATVVVGPALRGMPALPHEAVAVDDADLVAEEPSLLHLLNAAEEAGARVLLAGRAAPARWRVRLPDLASRLAATHAVPVAEPDETLLAMLFARLLSERQVAVAAPLQAWLLAHLPRHPAAIGEAAARLDRASLAAGRRVGRRLALGALESLLTEDESLMPPCPSPPSLL